MLVPVIFAGAMVSGIAALVIYSFGPGFGFRCAGVMVLFIWISVTLIGTAPINKGALIWEPDAPPDNWKALFSRWQRLDTFRAWAAILAFAFFLAAAALQLAGN